MGKIIVYCDGGCRGNQNKENVGAWAYTLKYLDHNKEDSGIAINTTNNKMELQAVIEALKAIKSKNIETIVHLDSAYVLNGITEWIHGWKQKNWRKSNKKPVENKELWIDLDNLRNQFANISFVKVKGHNGEQGNERVDELCNVAMDSLNKE